MTDLLPQYLSVTTWGAPWFHWIQLKVASLLHVSMVVKRSVSLSIAKGFWNYIDDCPYIDLSPNGRFSCAYGFNMFYFMCIVRVGLKTRDRRYKTIHGDSVVLLGPYGSGKTSLFYKLSLYASQNNPQQSEGTLPIPNVTSKVNIASITNAGVGEYSTGKASRRVLGKVIDIPGKLSSTEYE